MVSWATKRKIKYISILSVLAIFVIGGFLISSIVGKENSCVDKIQNQNELGIDCGGPCSALCDKQVSELIILWSRTLKTDEGFYDAVSFIDNPNLKGGVESIAYSIKLYDKDNIFIAEREGETFVNPNERFLVLENRISSGGRIPIRAFITFKNIKVWTKDSSIKPELSVKNKRFELSAPLSKLRATVSNNSLFSVEDIEVYAVLYNEDETIIAVSKTKIDILLKNSEKEISFIFPQKINQNPVRIDVLPRINRQIIK